MCAWRCDRHRSWQPIRHTHLVQEVPPEVSIIEQSVHITAPNATVGCDSAIEQFDPMTIARADTHKRRRRPQWPGFSHVDFVATHGQAGVLMNRFDLIQGFLLSESRANRQKSEP